MEPVMILAFLVTIGCHTNLVMALTEVKSVASKQNSPIIKDGSLNIQQASDEAPYLQNKDLSRQKREMTKEQIDFLRKLFANKLKPSDCPAGSEKRLSFGSYDCYECPAGTFWSGATRKCVKCQLGTYTVTTGNIGECLPCPKGTTTADAGAGNSSLCVEQCPFGHYSSNGMMKPVNCKACNKGTYTDNRGAKVCTKCPAGTTTSDIGAKTRQYCQVQCPAGRYSHNGLAPCDKCPLNTYQTIIGQKQCLKCPLGKTTLALGTTQVSECLVINECSSSPCVNGGSCVDGNNRFMCNCPPGWTGPTCAVNIDECASTPCWSGATCVDKVNDFKCVCPPGFQGKTCNQNINECLQKPCVNGGNCIDFNGDYECSCPAGYGGKTCMINQDDCIPGICLNKGNCVDRLNGFECKCMRGYRGEQCAENIDDCEHNACQNGASCVDGLNTHTCDCAPGFRGKNCEENINECASNPCRNAGQCTDGINDYHCTCPSFWGAKDCSRKLNDCFNLYMTPNTVEDYVIYNPPAKLPAIGQITVRYSMKSSDRGLQSHYGTIISYGLPGREGMFNIKLFPEQMLMVNGEDKLSGIDVTNGQWNTVCFTWRASDGRWRAYSGSTVSNLALKADAADQAISKSKVIDGGGMFVIGQLYQGRAEEFSDSNVYQGELTGLSVWYSWDQCRSSSTPTLAWPNLVYNGKMVTRTNSGMLKTGVKAGSRC